MCTDGLRKVGLYEERFKRIAPEIHIVYPDEDYQRLVTLGICNAKNEKRFENREKFSDHPYNLFLSVCQHMEKDKSVDGIVGGCTDISNVFYITGGGKFKYIDSLEVLADTIITESK